MFSRSKSTSISQNGRPAAVWLGLGILITLGTTSVLPQQLPYEIRGYKVHQEKTVVSTNVGEAPFDASVKIGDPELVDAGLNGVAFEIQAEVLTPKQSGKVDFFTFHEVKVNGIAVEVEEYRHPFSFKKGESVFLPKPARISLPVTGIVQAAWQELRGSKGDWIVTGRVFVFGRFRKFGMYHKRVVPVDFVVKIKNPLHNDSLAFFSGPASETSPLCVLCVKFRLPR